MNATSDTKPISVALAGTPDEVHDDADTQVVVTRMHFAASTAKVWDTIMFYEQIDEPPPWLLRRLLPVPLGTEGDKSVVGAEAHCRYQGGHLMKRVTEVRRPQRYAFVVSEQVLPFGGGVRLAGGSYTLRQLPAGHTEVALTTRYRCARAPRMLWRPIEAFVCHLFHRHILRSMRRTAER